MKQRLGFVSNSSSSSFMLVGVEVYMQYLIDNGFIHFDMKDVNECYNAAQEENYYMDRDFFTDVHVSRQIAKQFENSKAKCLFISSEQFKNDERSLDEIRNTEIVFGVFVDISEGDTSSSLDVLMRAKKYMDKHFPQLKHISKVYAFTFSTEDSDPTEAAGLDEEYWSKCTVIGE